MSIIVTLRKYFCQHRDMIRKTLGNRLYVECMKCGLESPGITL